MAQSGRKTIKIEAPVMLIEGTPVWMDKDWAVDFFDWLGKTKLKVSGMKHMQNKLQLTLSKIVSNFTFTLVIPPFQHSYL